MTDCKHGRRRTCDLCAVEEERDELRAQLAEINAAVVVACSEATKNARAVAFEEAARAFESPNYTSDCAPKIRALAPLPQTLVVVERETLEVLRKAIPAPATHSELYDAAIALLEKMR